ncbi:hypothetical protein ACFQ88_27830 [Paenibacillus sp. NPDC056579]|uniref:hypothetical protein n=1 Tax=Paenibacillus sp. NPDC056579 TaxID=3345871 RepID=UPI003681F782
MRKSRKLVIEKGRVTAVKASTRTKARVAAGTATDNGGSNNQGPNGDGQTENAPKPD